MTRLAILDDYQKVALQMADWKSLGSAVSVRHFTTRSAIKTRWPSD